MSHATVYTDASSSCHEERFAENTRYLKEQADLLIEDGNDRK
jgi:hypothetical protein